MFGGSGPAFLFLSVSSTNIFARADGDAQFLVYSMNVASTEPVAMILPLPVPADSPEDAVDFLDLKAYSGFFRDVVACFPPIQFPAARGGFDGPAPQALEAPLKVHQAGDFEASFVPRLQDFHRLDPRFRIDESIWEALPAYRDWGFAVFQLRDLGGAKPSFWSRLFGKQTRPDPKTIHPMAFRFPRRHPDRLFFPTVHVHDGELHETERFDHSLFWQTSDDAPMTTGIEYSNPAKSHVDLDRALGIVDGEVGFHRRQLVGTRTNQDHWAMATELVGDADVSG